MEKIIKDDLVKDSRDINTYIDQALKTYSLMDFSKNDGLKEFIRVATSSNDVTSIDIADFKRFFNLRLVMEYIISHNIDISHMQKEDRISLEKEISNDILKTVRGGRENYFTVKCGDVDSVAHTFILNIENADLISALSSIYSSAKKKNTSLKLEINRDMSVGHKNSLSISCDEKNLDSTIDILNSLNDINVLPPMNFVNNINDEIGYSNTRADGKTVIEVVYESLIHALDDVIASVSLEPAINDSDRFQKIESIKSSDAKNMIINKFKEYLTNSGLSLTTFGVFENKTIENNMEETVINVKKPEITFEENVLSEENITPEFTLEESVPEIPAFDAAEDVITEEPTTQEPVVDTVQDILPEAPIAQDELSDEDVQSILSNEETMERNNKPERIDVALKYKDVFPSLDILNQKITYDSQEMTILDYLEMNDVLNKIAIDKTYVDLEGVKLLGSEFIRERIVPYAKEVENTSVDEIINIYGLKEVKKKEKGRFLGKLFK